MNEPAAVWSYFSPVVATFWTWSDDDQTIVWIGGETIAFRAELATLFVGLIPVGLPSFDLVLLTLATCRSSAATTLPQLPELLKFDEYPLQHSLNRQVGNLRSQMWALSNLPENLRRSSDGKRAILSLVAENGPQLSKGHFVQDCIEWLRQGFSIKAGGPAAPRLRSTSEWSVLLRGLQDGLDSVNEAAVRLRMRAGLEPSQIPEPVPLNLPDPVPEPYSVWNLLGELEHDENHAGLFRLVKRLLSLMTLPPTSLGTIGPTAGGRLRYYQSGAVRPVTIE